MAIAPTSTAIPKQATCMGGAHACVQNSSWQINNGSLDLLLSVEQGVFNAAGVMFVLSHDLQIDSIKVTIIESTPHPVP